MKLHPSIAALALAAAPASAQFTLSEILVNSPGSDSGQESFEIRGGASTSLAGYTLLVLDGDGNSAGVVDQALDLSAFSTGTNGLFLWRDGASVISPAPDVATVLNVADFSPDLENGSITFVIGTGTVPSVGTDLDADNDGTFDVGALAGFTAVDAVSWLETDGAANYGYADDLGFTVVPVQTFTPDAVYRVYDGAGVPLRWSAGDVLGTNPGGPYAWDLVENFQLGSCGLDLGSLNLNVADSDGDGVPNTCDPLSAFCFGDGSGTACPCGNAGAAGNGCASSVNASGANLAASGVASTTSDTFVLTGTGMPNSSALYFQGTTQANGGLGNVFGDGLRCAGGSVIRLGTKINVAGTSSYPEAGDELVSIRGAIPGPGTTRTYQCWYRNAAAFCNPETFNLSNGVSVIWN